MKTLTIWAMMRRRGGAGVWNINGVHASGVADIKLEFVLNSAYVHAGAGHSCDDDDLITGCGFIS
jgi:hypothetical protein